MPKFYAVEVKTTAIVQVADDQTQPDVEELARDLAREIVRDTLDMDVEVCAEVKSQRQLSHYGWDGMCIPYGGDGNTRLQDLLPASS